MTLEEVIRRSLEIRRLYADFETIKYGKHWNRTQLINGFKKDVQDLAALTTIKTQNYNNATLNAEVAHELADCLWSVCIIAKEYEIDLQQAFKSTMNQIEEKLLIELEVESNLE